MPSTRIAEAEVLTTLQHQYGLRGRLHPLPGELDLNYRLDTSDGRRFTVKVAHAGEKEEHLDMQNAVMDHLAKKGLDLKVPQIIPNKKNEKISTIEDTGGHRRFLRVLSWIPGKLFAHTRPHTPALLENLGAACGRMCRALSDFDHPGARRWYKWDLAQTAWIEEHLHRFDSPQKTLIEHFYRLFREKKDVFQNQRKTAIYNDANDFNILVTPDTQHPGVVGFIDFGDVVHTQTVNDLAIAMAYGLMHKERPLEAARHMVRGFHRAYPLEVAEVELLYTLTAARLILSLTVSAINKTDHPDNEYLLVSEAPAWRLLEQWKDIPPALAHFAFREACGWVPCPKQTPFVEWVSKNQASFAPVIDLSKSTLTKLDLGVGSLDLGNNSNFDNIKSFHQTIEGMLEEAGADTGVGGYGEVRPVYSTDAYLIQGNTGPLWRTVHLGIDIWTEAGTPVFAPVDGVIHSFQNNAHERDYGPTIILEHRVNKKLTFYTLYGHLSLTSLEGLEKGMFVKKGQAFAAIGPAPENGNWPPHLHFQLILDMLEKTGDFPGVAFPDEKSIWLSLCPSGAPFFATGDIFSPSPAMDKTEILEKRKRQLGKSLSISYQKPLQILRGYGPYLYDDRGRRFLDMVNNVAHVGHEHPRVIRAAQRQMAVLNTNTRYLHPTIIQYAEKLLATFPPELNVVHFVNSGSEANELALRMVRTCTGRRDMIALEVGYHGNTTGCIDLSSYKFDGKGGKGAPAHTHVAPMPDTFRGLYRDKKKAGERYADHIRQTIEKVQSEGKNIGGFICESILSCGGQIVLPDGYLKKAFRYVRDAGGLCVADEVQVGFGRVGEKFWGFELQGVVPDIVTMGKPIGNGHPLAAVVTTEAVARQFANGMEYFSTFGGNPVSCAIGRAVLQVVKEEGLQQNAKETGQYLSRGLKELQDRFPLIGDVRGPGLFLGFELVKDPDELQPATEQAAYLANRMREYGILMSTDGPHNNVLKLKPPMCFNRKNADFFLETLEKVLQEDYLQRP